MSKSKLNTLEECEVKSEVHFGVADIFFVMIKNSALIGWRRYDSSFASASDCTRFSEFTDTNAIFISWGYSLNTVSELMSQVIFYGITCKIYLYSHS